VVALELMRSQPFDVAVLDYQMPEMKGGELARRIEAEQPGLPRLMLTAYPGLQEIVALREEHLVVAVLMKPWEAADVRHAIDLALSKAARPRSAGP
jgi:CheY-like chemotaxis protein